jgi:DNA-binding NarL/FixJ family response regulator
MHYHGGVLPVHGVKYPILSTGFAASTGVPPEIADDHGSRPVTSGAKLAPPTRKRILIVDDHPITRRRIMLRVRAQPDLDICGEADSAYAAVAAVMNNPPDLVLSDVSLGNRSALELIKELHLLFPTIPVLVFSVHNETLYAERSLRAGARGYLMKTEGAEKLIDAIRHVLHGKIYLSASMLNSALHQFAGGPSAARGDNSATLSDRELEVFELMGRGLETRDISDLLHVTVSTIATHRAHIKEKLNVAKAAELVRVAQEWLAAQNY